MTPPVEEAQTVDVTKSQHESSTAKKPADRRVLACGTCRRRKLKCEGGKPKCATCQRLGHPCEYDEVRKKSGPKRGYVKELEARLKHVETLLTSQTTSAQSQRPQQRRTQTQEFDDVSSADPGSILDSVAQLPDDLGIVEPSLDVTDDFTMTGIEDFNWDMISLGLEEPLPPSDIMDDLYQAFFDKIHPSLPVLHRYHFMASLNKSINQKPPVCLRYIMWAHACQVIPQYKSSAEQFYLKSRKYLEQDEMRGLGESFVSVAHAQTWCLVGSFEFKNMYFPRAWMSCGRAARLSFLLGLNRVDRESLEVKQALPPPRDWIEKEERRRTFWLAYCEDRYASIGTGWPMSIDERDIHTNLPASEEAFLAGREEITPTLADALEGKRCENLSSFAGVSLLSALFGRNLTHLHRPSDDDDEHDLNGGFWRRHRQIDNILLNTSMALPSHLRLPNGVNDPNIVFTNMNIHTSTICLHQAAILKADKHQLPAQISAESKRRCIVAAGEITSIMKLCCHQDLGVLNPFIAFCLYVSARVFVQYLKARREDTTVLASLSFLLSAMAALRQSNPLTESFLVQLEVDLEGTGLQIVSPLSKHEQSVFRGKMQCMPPLATHQTQSTQQQTETFNSDFDLDTALGFGARPVQSARVADGSNQSRHPPGLRTGQLPGSSMLDNTFGGAVNTKQSPQDSASSSQPTPSTYSRHNSSNTSFSPPADTSTRGAGSTHNFASRSADASSGSNMPATMAFSPMGPSGYSYINGKAGFARPIVGEPQTAHDASIGIDQKPSIGPSDSQGITAPQQNTHDAFGMMFESTGFTPGPSELTPGPGGMAWSEITVDDDDQWMYNN